MVSKQVSMCARTGKLCTWQWSGGVRGITGGRGEGGGCLAPEEGQDW